jgi:hypothetical protein
MIRLRTFSLILTLTLLLSSLPGPVRATNLADGEPVPETLKAVPGATTDWWSAVQEDIRQSEYHVTWQERAHLEGVGAPSASDIPSALRAGAYQAPNRAHNLRTTFTPQGIRVVPRVFEGETPPWEWGLTLSGYGYASAPLSRGADDVQSVAAATLQVEANRVAYARDALTEWYVNDEHGLEQGFTLQAPPQSAFPNPRSEIVLDLALSGGLTPNLTEDGSAIEFTTPGGVRVLRYGDLFAYDDTGRTLPAQMELITNPVSGSTEYTLRIVVDDANAVYPITIDPLATSPTWTAESNQAGAQFGWAVGTAGDVNGDYYDDVIVGAPCYDNGQIDEGRAYVYHGSSTGLSTTADWTAEGNQAGAQFGWAVGTAGDVNDDYHDDVIVGAPYYDNGQTDEGRAYVYHGSSTGPSTTADWTAESNQADARFGYSVGAGDVNGDYDGDVIVGAPYYDNGQTDEGRAYAYHASPTGLSTTADWTAESDQAGAHFGWAVGTANVNHDIFADVIVGVPHYDNGQEDEGRACLYHGTSLGATITPSWTTESGQTGAELGYSVATAGDVNGDYYDDLIIGAYSYDNGEIDEGRAFVYHGSAAWPTSGPDWTVEGNSSTARLGRSVGTAGDVNGDGYSDVIVGMYGRVYVYHGSAAGLALGEDWSAEGDVWTSSFGRSVGTAGDVNGDGFSDVIIGATKQVYVYHGSATGLSTTADWTVEGGDAHFGISVATAGDVNGDGYSDIIIGAGSQNVGAIGQAYVYYGSATGLSTTAYWIAEGEQGGAGFGASVDTGGDVNGDGYSDVIVGAPYYDNSGMDEGRAYVYYGSPMGLASSPAWTANGDQDEAGFGYAVGTAGDVNGDGYSDVVIGAPYRERKGVPLATDEGRAYVYHGSATGLSTSPAWAADGGGESAWFGHSAQTAGDMNGDGYADVIVGAPRYGGQERGHAFVYHGSPAGLSPTADLTCQGGAYEWLGYSVGTAGDANGDGYSDVIVGAPYYCDPFNPNYPGRAYVYHGAVAPPSSIPSWSAESDQADAGLGFSAGTAGDVNGDGYSDVVVGAPAYDNGETDEGRAFVFHGSAAGLSTTLAWAAEGDQDGAEFGASVGTARDVNGDGYADVVVGAPSYDGGQTDEGRAFVYHGSAVGLSTTPNWTGTSNQDEARFGWSVGTAGDVNGDGYSDVIVGACQYDTGYTDEGRATVYHGSATGLSTTPNWTGTTNQDEARFGWSVGTAGDVNGDGYSDVIVGAAWYGNGQAREGRVYVYHGSVTGLSAVAAWTAESDQSHANFGASVGTAGDVNGDGYSDIIVGAPLYDNGQEDEGRATVYHGSATGLSTTSTWTAESNQEDAYFGYSVGTAGDVDSDGCSDIIVGAYSYDNGKVNEGRAYVYHGSATGLSTAPDWTTEGDQDWAYFGWSVGTAGDVNGDGYADVIIGAVYHSHGEMYEGCAFLYYGNEGDGLHLLPRQLRRDGSAPIAPPGMPDSGTAFRLSLIGRMPLGREDVRLQWQVAPLGTPISATTVISGVSGWTDVLTTGVEITQTVTGLVSGTPYHWRVRLLYRPGNAMGLPAGRWIHIPWNGWNETDLRTGPNHPPEADAGSDQSVKPLALVTLDGSGSSDPDGHFPLTYGWTQTGGPAVALSDPAVVSPTFIAPSEAAVLTFTLAVTDSLGLPDPTPDEVVVTVNNQPPVADAGSDQSVDTLALVALDGSGSSDPDGDLPLAHRWTQTGGPAVTLSNPAVAGPTFTAPSDPAVLTFTLAVTDNLGLPGLTPDEVVVTVSNQAPVADAGINQSVNIGAIVSLDGSDSSDPDGDLPLAHRWTQTGGPAVMLNNPAAVGPAFIAPSEAAVLTFTLAVTDSLGLPDPTPDEVVVTVIADNQPPAADAGGDQSVGLGATVTLDGSGSGDPDGDLPLTYGWTQTGGPAVAFTPSLGVTTFTAPSEPTVLTFTLVVTDSLGLPDPTPDQVVVTVEGYCIYLPLVVRQDDSVAAQEVHTHREKPAGCLLVDCHPILREANAYPGPFDCRTLPIEVSVIQAGLAGGDDELWLMLRAISLRAIGSAALRLPSQPARASPQRGRHSAFVT